MAGSRMTITNHVKKFERYYAQNPKVEWLGNKPDYYSQKSYNGRNKTIVDIVKNNHSSLILDIGCGTGDLMILSKPYCHFISGVEPTYINREVCLSKGLEVRSGVAERLPVPDKVVDTVIMADVIEHLYNPFEALMEAYRVLIPGGILIITTPNKIAEWFWYLSSSKIFRKSSDVPDNLFTTKALADLCFSVPFNLKLFDIQEFYPRSKVGKWLLHRKMPWSELILKLGSKIKWLNYRQIVVLQKVS
jgi:SAM-dependent methyltransferase